MKRDLKQLVKGWRWGRRPLVPASAGRPILEPREFSTDWARTPAARVARALILRAGFAPLLSLEVSRRVAGLDVLENLEPPVLFAANHSSHLDAPLVLTSLPPRWRERTAVGAAADYFFDVWWRAFGTALAFNTFPVERMGSRRSAGPAPELLADGWNILAFPEGTRSRDGWVAPFRHGVARLSMTYRLPVVPIALRGAYQAMPRGRGWPVPGRPQVVVRFGRPLLPEDGESTRDFTARIRDALAFGLQEETTSWWDALRRRERGETFSPSGPEAADWRRKWESSRPIGPEGRPKAWRR